MFRLGERGNFKLKLVDVLFFIFLNQMYYIFCFRNYDFSCMLTKKCIKKFYKDNPGYLLHPEVKRSVASLTLMKPFSKQ